MTYNKPEVVKLDSALSAIQGIDKLADTNPDHRFPTQMNATIGAYESDE